MLYITHYMEEAELLCDHVAIMDQGKIIANDTVSNLIETTSKDYTIEVETEYKESAFRELQKKYSEERLKYHDGKLCLIENNIGNTVPKFINEIYKMGCSVKKVEIKEPSLQQVFLQLTGKVLRV